MNLKIDPHCKALWELNERSGNALDSSGNGHTLTPFGGVTYNVDGKFEKCFSFNGTDAYLRGEASADFRVVTGDFTLGAWVYAPLSASALTCIINHGYGEVAGWMLYYYPSGAYCYIQSVDGGITSFDLPNSIDVTADWNLIIVSRSSGTMSMSLNNVNQSLIDDTFGTQSMNYDGYIYLGKYSTYYINRRLDDPFFFDRALTANEKTSIYNTGVFGGIGCFIGVGA